MASPQWRRGQRSEGHASAKRVRFDLPRVHGQWPGTIRGAEPTAGSSFVVGNYITDKTTLTRLRLHQTHPANDSTPQAAPNLQPNTSFMLRGGSAETMRVLSCGVARLPPDASWNVMRCHVPVVGGQWIADVPPASSRTLRSSDPEPLPASVPPPAAQGPGSPPDRVRGKLCGRPGRRKGRHGHPVPFSRLSNKPLLIAPVSFHSVPSAPPPVRPVRRDPDSRVSCAGARARRGACRRRRGSRA